MVIPAERSDLRGLSLKLLKTHLGRFTACNEHDASATARGSPFGCAAVFDDVVIHTAPDFEATTQSSIARNDAPHFDHRQSVTLGDLDMLFVTKKLAKG